MLKTPVALMAAAIACLAAPAAHGGSWTEPAPIPTPTGFWDLAVAPDGGAYGLWAEGPSGGACDSGVADAGCAIRVAHLGADGWGDPVTLSTAGADSFVMRIVVDSAGVATALWLQIDGGTPGSSVWASRSSGRSWEPAQRLSSTGLQSDSLGLAVNASGTVVAAWPDDISGRTHSAVFSGGTWSPATVVPTGDQRTLDIETLIAEPDGSFTILLQRTLDYRIGASRLSGGAWTDEGLISPSGDVASEVAAVVAPDGTVTAIWRSYAGGDDDTVGSARRVNGVWQSPDVVAVSPDNIQSPSLGVAADGTVTAIWSEFISEPLRARYAVRSAGGWSAPAVVPPGTPTDVIGLFPDGNDRLLALLVDRPAALRGVWTTVVDGTWAPTRFVSEGSNFRPNLAAGRDGMIVAQGGYPYEHAIARYGTAPSAPTGVVATAGNRVIGVRWTAPSRPGAPITGYTATAEPGGARCTATGATACTIRGLSPGTAYRVSVTAANVFGTGAAGSAGAPVTTSPGARMGRIRPPAAGSAARIAVPVTAPGPGEVTLTGMTPGRADGGRAARAPVWRCTVRATFARAGTRTLQCPLRAGARRTLRRGAMRYIFRAAFYPADGGAGIVTTATAVITKRR